MKRLLLNCFLLLSLFTFSNQLVSGQSCVNDNYCDNDTDLLLNCPDVPTWTEYFWEVTEINGTGNPGTVIPELIRVDGTDYYFTPSNVPNGYIGVELYVVCVRGTPTNRQGQLWKSVRVRQAPSLYDLSGPADVCQGEPFTMQLANSAGVTTTYRLFSEDSGSPKGVSGGQNGAIDFNLSIPTPNTYTFYVVADDGFCSSEMPVARPSVIVNELPDLDAGADVDMCAGDPAVTLTATTSIGGATFLWSTGETTQSINVAPAATTTYTVTITNAATSCEASDDVTVTVNPLPDVDAGLDQTICFGDPTVALTATTSVGGATYLWSTGETTQTINVSPAATTTYTVTVTNPATGCEGVDNVTVNVDPLPDVDAGLDQTICFGDPAVALTATTSVGGATFLWSTGETTQTINVSPAATTVYTVTVTNPATGCDANDNVTVNVNDLPDVNAGADVAICAGDPAVTLTATTSVPTVSYLWSTGETTQSIDVAPAATTTYTVTITNTATGCSDSDDVIVTVNPLPDVDAGLDQTICFGDPAVALTATTSVGGATFLWSSGETTQTINVSPAVTTIYTVTVTNPATGCEASDIVTVNVDPLPDVDAGLDQTICFGDPAVALTATTSVGGATFLWSTGETTQTINVSPAATTIYTVTVTNPATGCEASDNVTINVNALPDVNAGADVAMCAGDPAVTLTATTSVPTVSYLWSTGETTQSIDVAPAATTTYTVTITNTSTGCEDSDDVIVTVNPLPDVNAGVDQTICLGDPAVALTATTSVGGATFLWSTGETTQTINVSPATTTTYSVTVTNPATGCEANDEVIVNVNNVTANISISAPVVGGTEICAGTTVTFNAAGVGGSGNYNYDFHRVRGAADVSVQNSTTPTYSDGALQDGDIIYVVVTDITNTCIDQSVNITMTVNANPVVSLNITNPASGSSTVCTGTNVVFTASGTYDNYEFYLNGVSVQSGASNTYSNNTLSTGDQVFVEATQGACSGSSVPPIVMTVNDLPSPTLVSDQAGNIACPAEEVTFTAGGGDLYEFFVDGISQGAAGAASEFKYIHPTNTAYNVTVIVTDGNGCIATSTPVNITFDPATAGLGADNTTICAGEDVTFTATGGVSYEFFVDGASVQGPGAEDVYVAAGLTDGQVVTVEVTNGNGCTDTHVGIPITVTALPVPGLTSSDPDNIICAGDAVTFTATGGAWYEFFVNGISVGAGSATDTYTTSALVDGDRVSVVVAIGPGGCSATSGELVHTVNSLPSPTLVSDQAGNIACPAEEVTFTAGGGDLYEFFVDGISQGAAGATSEFKYIHPTNTAYNVTVIVTDGNGCIATSTPVNITFDPATAGLGADNTTICAGEDVTFTATGGVSYEFFVDGASVQGPGAADVYVAAGLTDGQVVTVGVTNGNGCTDTHVGIPITVTALPVPGLTSSDPDNIICAGDAVTFTATGGAWYEFFVNGISVGAGSATDTYTTSALVDGDRVSVVVAIGPGGCSATSGELVHTVNPLPTASLVSDALTGNACPGQEVTFTAGGGVNYQFILDDVAQGVAGPSNEFKHITAGDFKVEVLVIDVNGCEATSPAILITEDAATAGLTADRTTICAGDDVTFTATGGVTYEFLIDDVPQVVGDPTNNIFVASGLTDGQIVKVKVTNATGCEDTHTGIGITVNALPTADISSSDADNTICVGDEVTFTASGGDLYEFFINGVSVGAASAVNTYVTNTLADGDRVSVEVTNTTTTCSQMSAELVHTVNPLPTADVTANTGLNIISGTDVTFTGTGGVEYEFFKNTILVQARSGDDTYGPVNDLADGDVISVNVYNANGCMSSASITMSVVDGISPYDLLSSATEYCEDESGVSLYLATPQAGVSYRLIRTSDDQVINPIILFDGSNVVRWDDVTVPAALASEEFRVEGFYPTVPGSELEMNNRVTITRNNLPTVYSIQPTGTVTGCGGGAGHEVKLENSETGVTYQLMLDGGNIGAPVNGNSGNEITFGFQTIFGEYTIMATNATTGCNRLMSNTFTIDPDGTYTSFNVSGEGNFCIGDAGANIVLEGSEATVEYRVVRDGLDIGDSWTGDGSAHTFGPYNIEGSYSVVVNTTTGCQYPMNGVVNVVEVALPKSYDLIATNNGHFCPGDIVSITISGQQNGIDYELFHNDVSVAVVTGTIDDDTAPLNLGDYGIAGTYRVEARTSGVVCSAPMNNELALIEDALPTVFNVTSDGDYCTGGTTFLHIDGSESDVQYRWEREGDLVTGLWVDGNGGILDFEITGTDTYYIVAMRKDGVTSCASEMTPRVAVTEKVYADLTKVLSIKPGTGLDCNNGAVIIVETSEAGVDYELVKSGVRSGNIVTGDGNDVEFPTPVLDIAATYEVYADKDGCEQTLINTIYIDVPGAMTQYAVTGSGDICNGDPGQQFGVAYGDNGVNYTLYLADAPGSTSGTVQQTIIGSDNPITFDLVNNPGEYYVMADDGAGCAIEMLNRETLIVHPLPIAYKISGSGKYCSTEAGAYIKLESSEVGVEYIVQMGGIQQGTRVSGSGSELTFGPFTAAGDYSVVAYNSTTLCTSNMNGVVTVSLDADIVNYDIINTEFSYCEAAGGIEIILAGQQDGVSYQVFNLAMELKAEVVGDASGSQLNFGILPEGTYTIIASYGGDGCVTPMNSNNAIVITSQPSPQSFNVTTTEFVNICQGTTINIALDGSEDTRVYNVVDDLDNVVATATGDGNALTIPRVCNEVGDNLYEVIAVGNPSCDLLLDVVKVSVKTAPAQPVVEPTIDMNYCWDADGIKVSLTAVEAGIDYYIVDKATGSRISFLSGDAGVLEFKESVLAGTYYVTAKSFESGCDINSLDFTVNAYSEIEKFRMQVGTTAGGFETIEDGETGTGSINLDLIGLELSTVGVRYTLLRDNVPYSPDYVLESGTGNPFQYTNALPVGGLYSILAEENGCSRLMAGSVNIFEKPLEAIDDVLPVTYGQNVADTNVWFNDISLSSIDINVGPSKNIYFKLLGCDEEIDVDDLVPWDSEAPQPKHTKDRNGSDMNLVEVYPEGTVVFTKLPSFYGRDSIDYVVYNTDYLGSNRYDRGRIYFFAGNINQAEDDLLIPNAFSPNGDTYNDEFVISQFKSEPSESKLEVYNRWGSIVYRSKGNKYGIDSPFWDGTSNAGMVSLGKKLPSGTYFYVFKVDISVDSEDSDSSETISKEYSGFIELRR